MSKKYNWKVGDKVKVKVKRKLTNNDYRWVYPDNYIHTNLFEYELDKTYKIIEIPNNPDEKNCVIISNGALIPNHMLIKSK